MGQQHYKGKMPQKTSHRAGKKKEVTELEVALGRKMR